MAESAACDTARAALSVILRTRSLGVDPGLFPIGRDQRAEKASTGDGNALELVSEREQEEDLAHRGHVSTLVVDYQLCAPIGLPTFEARVCKLGPEHFATGGIQSVAKVATVDQG